MECYDEKLLYQNVRSKSKKFLKDMAKEDKRSISYKIAWLNNEEWNRRHKEQEKQVEISFL